MATLYVRPNYVGGWKLMGDLKGGRRWIRVFLLGVDNKPMVRIGPSIKEGR